MLNNVQTRNNKRVVAFNLYDREKKTFIEKDRTHRQYLVSMDIQPYPLLQYTHLHILPLSLLRPLAKLMLAGLEVSTFTEVIAEQRRAQGRPVDFL